MKPEIAQIMADTEKLLDEFNELKGIKVTLDYQKTYEGEVEAVKGAYYGDSANAFKLI